MIVATDIDNCLGDLNVFLQERFGLDLSVYPAPLPDGFFSSPEGLEMLWRVRPFAGAAMSLWGAAASGFRLVYLSSRPRGAALVTRRWLAVHGFPPGEVVLTGDKVGWVLARRQEVFLVVEDDPRVALALARADVPVYLIDWPYNRGIEHPRITRAAGLPVPGVGAATRKEGFESGESDG